MGVDLGPAPPYSAREPVRDTERKLYGWRCVVALFRRWRWARRWIGGRWELRWSPWHYDDTGVYPQRWWPVTGEKGRPLAASMLPPIATEAFFVDAEFIDYEG